MANAGKLFWLAAFTFIARMSLADAADFQPNYQNAELRGSDGAIFARVGIDLKSQHIQEAGGRKFLVHDDGLEIFSSEPDEETRRIRSTDGRKLRLLATAGRIALFAAEKTADELQAGQHDLPAEIRRCDLRAAHWLSVWKIDGGEAPPDSVPQGGGPVLGNVMPIIFTGRRRPTLRNRIRRFTVS